MVLPPVVPKIRCDYSLSTAICNAKNASVYSLLKVINLGQLTKLDPLQSINKRAS